MPNDAITLDVSTMPEDGDYAQFEAWRKGEKEEAAPAAEEAKTAPESDPEEDQEPEKEEPAKPEDKAVKGVQKRIDELTKARREAERRAEEAERKLAETQGSRPAKEDAQPPANDKPAAEGEPDLNDFPTLEAYYKALVKWELKQASQAEAAATEVKKAKESADAAQKAWSERETVFKGDHDDYDEVLDTIKIPKTPAVPAIQQAVLESEIGPAILYELGKHPEEAARIAALSPTSAIREIGKIEARLSAKAPEKPQPKKDSSAPPPPVRVGSRPAAAAKAVDDPDLDYAEFERLQNARERRNRK